MKSAWSPPTGPLGALTSAARRRAADLEERARALELAALQAPRGPDFVAALRRATVAVIAEVKRASPSKGVINSALDAGAQARAYAEGGAAAISVLTEPERFGGRLEDLGRALPAGLPLLRKDFIVSPAQLAEARAHGASAALLIARALGPGELESLVRDAGDFGLAPLVEVRDEAELERALATPAMMIGVNNRDLETLHIDRETGGRLLPLIPDDRIAVAESGVESADDVVRYADAGADAVLVGSVLSASPRPAEVLRRLAGVTRRPRG